VKPAVEAILLALGERRASITSLEPKAAFDRLDELTELLDFAGGVGSHIEAMGDKAFREQWNDAQQDISKAYSEIYIDGALYAHLKRSHETLLSARQAPSAELLRYMETILGEFERNGADLAPEKQQQLVAIDAELTDLTLKIAQHAVDASAAFELVVTDANDLRGVPASVLEAARASAESKGVSGYRFTLAGPSYLSFMSHAPARDLRRQMYEAYNSRATAAPFDNRELLQRVVALRQERARLVLYPTFAALTLKTRMAKTPERVALFLSNLRDKLEAPLAREHAALSNFQAELDGERITLEPWDLAFYAEKQRKALYDFDDEALRPYFILPQVLQGLFAIAEQLFGVKVRALEAPEMSWDPAVAWYTLSDGGVTLGKFALDLFPREGKRDGAWMHGLVDRLPGRQGMHESLAIIEANMSEPRDGVARLTHREVQTLFHEFGHLLHHMLSNVSIRALSGTKVAWDFVELPSQILENWCWEKEGLALFAKHEKTGQPIPDEMMDRMQRARTFRGATALMRQLSFADVDLKLHSTYDPTKDGDVLSYARKIMQPYVSAKLPESFGMLASFLHLFSSPVGYASGYYSYQWAEVLDADAFAKFKEHGIMNAEVGRAFRTAILEKGDSAAPEELFHAFRGRAPTEAAILARLGLPSS
jgi:oligopeptidase A